MDGWCTNMFLFSISVPSLVEFFGLPFLSPDLRFFLRLYFLPAPFPVSFWGTLFSPCPPPSFFFFLSKLPHPRPPNQPTSPHCPPLTYSPINLKCVTFIPTHLLTHPSIYLPTCPSTFLPTNILDRYLSNPTYMATPTYLVAIPTDPQ